MNKTVQLMLLFALTFVIGGVSGYFLRGTIPQSPQSTQVRDERPRWREMPPEQRDRLNERMRDRMIAEMSLREDQQDVFFTLVNRHRREMRNILDESRQQADRNVRTQADSLQTELSRILDATQLERWNQLQGRMGYGANQSRPRN
jgi:DNA-directed RNA polymerase specialized sigma subunit